MTTQGNSAQAQRNRLLAYLRTRSIDTIAARRDLDILMPAARIFELRKRGHDISTIWVDRPIDSGKVHRVALYALQIGAAGTAPNHEVIEAHTENIGSHQISTRR